MNLYTIELGHILDAEMVVASNKLGVTKNEFMRRAMKLLCAAVLNDEEITLSKTGQVLYK